MADHNKKQAKSFGEGVRGYMKGLEVVDYRLIISIVFLVMFGLIMVYSASNAQYGASLLKRQFVIGGLGYRLPHLRKVCGGTLCAFGSLAFPCKGSGNRCDEEWCQSLD